jgi:hypothetical protein
VTSREFRERLSRRARRAGLAVPAPLKDSLEAYYRLLALWNARINLTALDLESADEAIDRLLIEPLLAARLLPEPPCALLDIGSGGGSPHSACWRPRDATHMVEEDPKVGVSREASAASAHRLAGRDGAVRLLTRPDLHEAVDVVTVRAVRVELRVLMGLRRSCARR